MSQKDLPVFVEWLSFMKGLSFTIDKMPKKTRFTISERIYNLGLEIAEDLVDARFEKKRALILNSVNRKLEKIRVLLRISHESKFLSTKDFYRLIEQIGVVGRMIGGWLSSQTQNER